MAKQKRNTKLDSLNQERYEESLATVKKIMREVCRCHCHLEIAFKNSCENSEDEHVEVDSSIEKRLAKAINCLADVSEKMTWHCEHFDYDQGVCLDIDSVCGKLGDAIANLDNDIIIAVSATEEAINKLAKVLATLVVWDSEEEEGEDEEA